MKAPPGSITANHLWTSTCKTFLSNQIALEYYLEYLLKMKEIEILEIENEKEQNRIHEKSARDVDHT